MRTYYRLEEDLYIRDRWYLGGPTDDSLRDDREFRYGYRTDLRGSLVASIYKCGIPLDFSLTLSQVPVLSKRVANAIRLLAGDDAQFFPVHIEGYDGFEVMNTASLVRCLDESRSEFTKWTDEDGRPDLIGHYQMVTKLRIDAKLVPLNMHVFRIRYWELPLIVSQAFVDAILPLNPIGPKLELVT